jgi:hypothetical protein
LGAARAQERAGDQGRRKARWQRAGLSDDRADDIRLDGRFQAAGKAHGKEIFADIPNFTKAQSVVQINDIVF